MVASFQRDLKKNPRRFSSSFENSVVNIDLWRYLRSELGNNTVFTSLFTQESTAIITLKMQIFTVISSILLALNFVVVDAQDESLCGGSCSPGNPTTVPFSSEADAVMFARCHVACVEAVSQFSHTSVSSRFIAQHVFIASLFCVENAARMA